MARCLSARVRARSSPSRDNPSRLITCPNPSLPWPRTLRGILDPLSQCLRGPEPHMRDFAVLDDKMEAPQAYSAEAWMFWCKPPKRGAAGPRIPVILPVCPIGRIGHQPGHGNVLHLRMGPQTRSSSRPLPRSRAGTGYRSLFVPVCPHSSVCYARSVRDRLSPVCRGPSTRRAGLHDATASLA